MNRGEDTRTPLERALERVELCRQVVKEVHNELEIPNNPNDKADLYLSIEDLTIEVFRLRNTVSDHVWGPPQEDIE